MGQTKRFAIMGTVGLFLLAAGLPGYAKMEATTKAKSKGKAPLSELKLIEGDERGNEIKSLKAELLVSTAEKKAIQQAQKLLRNYRGTPLEPELEFRLAELYMRRSKTDRFFEVHRESETVVRLAPRLVKTASSRTNVVKAVDTYSRIQKKFTQFPQMDLVIFNHAFARQILDQEKQAETLYNELIAKHGRSPLVPDAHLAVGEIAFQRGQFPAALEHFNAIRKYKNSRVYPYGLYKAAWTHYNMRDARKGLKTLEEVVEFGRHVARNKLESRLDLRKEALADMTLFYEDVYPSNQAYDYFRAQAGEAEVGPILLKMATLYERHSRFEDQRVVLDKFIEELPTSPLLPQVHKDLVLAHDQLRQREASVARLEQLHQLCAPNSPWVKAQAKASENAPKIAEECQMSLNETSLKLASKWLRAWKKLPKDTSHADAAERAFEIYLRSPSASEEHAKARYTYAELLFARQKFRKASEQYAMVSQSEKSAKLGHDASYAAVLSFEKAVGETWSAEDERSFHKLAQDYVRRNPKGEFRLDIEYKMALLAYEKARYEEAGPVFLRLGREFPTQEKGQKSQDLYLDILNIKKDYRGIRDYAMELSQLKHDPTRSEKMRKLYEQAYFLEIQGMEEKGKVKEALAEYEIFAKKNPGSEFTEKAVWNAMQLHYKVGDSWNGARTAADFADKYPTSKNAINALLRAAQTFEHMGQLSEAARVLRKLAARDEKSATRWKELAADFHALDGEQAAARVLYNDLKSSAKAADRNRLLAKVEALEKTYGTKESHAAALKAMIDANIQPHASLVKVEALEQELARGRHTDAFNNARRLLGSGMSSDLKARVRLVQARVLEQEFLKQSVKSRADRVATVLAIKTEKLQKAQEAFQSAIKYGNPDVSVQAFEGLYGLYAHYVKALKEMPPPSGLSAEDAQVFKSEIDNLVIPLEEKSVDTLAQAVQFARKQQFLDGTTDRLEEELAKVNHQVRIKVVPDPEVPALALPVLAEVGI